jgi:hypothetical protein
MGKDYLDEGIIVKMDVKQVSVRLWVGINSSVGRPS